MDRDHTFTWEITHLEVYLLPRCIHGTVSVKEAPIPVTDISLNKTETTIETGLTETLIPIFTPEGATNKKVTWKSSDPAVATVSDQGVVTGITEGQAIITVTTEKCDRCNERDTRTDEHSALGHDVSQEWIIDKEPTCIETGSKSRYCSRCGERVEIMEVPAWGHAFGEWITVDSPTCNDKGSEKRICSVCQFSETRDVEAAGHSWESDYTIDKEPTCIETGSKSIHCSQCDAVKDSQAISALGHRYGEWIIDQEATCTENGNKHHTCTVCGQEENSLIPARQHSFGEWITITSPTCTEDGKEEHTCSNCRFTEIRSIQATGHQWEDNFTIDKEPTVTEAGSKSIHCKNCNERKDITKISVIEKPSESIDTSGDTNISDSRVPQTGDSSPIIVFVTLSVVSSVLSLILIVSKSVKNR